MWNLKKTEQINKKQKQRTYKIREQTDGSQRGGDWGMGKMDEGQWEIRLWKEQVTGMKDAAYRI